MFLNIQMQFLFYILSFIIQCESYKWNKSKSFFYAVFPAGHPPIIWLHCQATSPTLPHSLGPATALAWNLYHPIASCPSLTTPVFDHTQTSLGHKPFPSRCVGPSWPYFLCNSSLPSHLAFQPHLISKNPPWTNVMICCLSSCIQCWESTYTEALVNLVSNLGGASAPLHISFTFSLSAHLLCPSVTEIFQIISILFKFPTPFYFAGYFIKYLWWPRVSYVSYKLLPASMITTEFTFKLILLRFL